jgi:hypothetical protein
MTQRHLVSGNLPILSTHNGIISHQDLEIVSTKVRSIALSIIDFFAIVLLWDIILLSKHFTLNVINASVGYGWHFFRIFLTQERYSSWPHKPQRKILIMHNGVCIDLCWVGPKVPSQIMLTSLCCNQWTKSSVALYFISFLWNKVKIWLIFISFQWNKVIINGLVVGMGHY